MVDFAKDAMKSNLLLSMSTLQHRSEVHWVKMEVVYEILSLEKNFPPGNELARPPDRQ